MTLFRFRGNLALIALALIAAQLTGCAGLGPTKKADWKDQVTAASPKDDGEIDFLSASIWYPDTQGFADMRGVGFFLPHNMNMRRGVFALTKESLLFFQWDARLKKYGVLYRTPFADVHDAKVDFYLALSRLVVFGKDYRAQSFDITYPSGGSINKEAQSRALKLVTERMTKR